MLELIVSAILAFLSTNVDDIFILITLFTLTSKTISRHHIMIGQYLGFVCLIIISIIGSLLGLVIPKAYIGLLGFFPVYIGITKFIQHVRGKNACEEDVEIGGSTSNGLLRHVFGVHTINVAAITFANGGDNIAIYIPFFTNLSYLQLLYTVMIFLTLVYLLVKVAWYLTKHPLITDIFKKYNHIVFPLVLVLLGLYIVIESGTISLIHDWVVKV